MDALCRIVEPIGYPLTMDKATSTKSRPTTAKLRVELDLAKPRIREVAVEIRNAEGGLERFTQKVDYEDLPEFCSHCMTQGHTNDKCRVVLQRNQSKKVASDKGGNVERKENQGQTQNDGQQPTKTTEEVAPNHQAAISETEKIQNEDEGWQVVERKKGKGHGSNKISQNYKNPQHNHMHQQMEKSSQVHKEENDGMEIIEPQIEGEQTLINTIRDHIKSRNNKREKSKQQKAKVQKERMGTRNNKNVKIADLSKLQEEQQREAESQINLNVNTTRQSSRKRKPTAKVALPKDVEITYENEGSNPKDGEVVKPNFGLDPDLADKIVGNKVKEKKMNSYKENNSVSIQILDPGDEAVENQNNTWDEDLEMTQVGIEGSKSDDDIARGYDKTIDFVDYDKT